MLPVVTLYRIGRLCFVASLLLFFSAGLQAKPIKLRSGAIDPRRQPARAQAQGQAEDGLYLVQLRDGLPAGWRAQVRQMGVQLLRYVPEDTYVARIPAGSVARVNALPFVEFVGEYLPEHKVHPRLAGMLTRPGLQSHDVSILISRTATAAELNAGRAAFLNLRQQNTLPFGSILRGHISHTKLAELARSHVVIWIEPAPNFKLVDETAAKIVAGDGGPGQTFVQSLGFDGSGVTVAVPDSGLHNGDTASMHPDLFGRVTAFFHYGTLSDAADEHSHGTHVAGIIAGNGATGEFDEFGELYGLGVAPQARIIAQRIFDGIGNYEAPPSFAQLTGDAVRAGADIASNSWGDDTQGRYDLSAAEFDALVRDADVTTAGNQEFIIEFSAGNAGSGEQTIGSPAVAKNVIATGASQNNRFDFVLYAEGQDAMADFSSRGPCEDGRIKPDVVAPGTWIASLKSASAGTENAWAEISENYIYQGGTSQAGPQVSGAAAVLVQYLREIYGMPRPSPALIKAMLINSAIDMDDSFGTAAIPNADEGWGRVDLTEIIGSPRGFDLVDQTTWLVENQSFERRVVAATALEPLRITLAYTDVPGFPGVIPALVNDLDLVVIAPDGTVYNGNQFHRGESIPNSLGRDAINNVEAVYLAAPMPGEYIVRVRAIRVAEDSRIETQIEDQDFALVISGDIPIPGTGLVLLDRRAYTAPGTMRVQVIDDDLAGQPSVNVQVRSTTEPTGETVLLRASNATGSFTGSVATVTGAPVGDSRLQVAHNDTIEAIYQDASLGQRTATARADLLPPVLSNPTTTNAFGRMLVRWQSDEPANSIVRFGTNATLTGSATNFFLTQNHEVSLEGLLPGRTYFFAIISADEAGNRTTNNNNGALFSFVAAAAAAVLLVDAYVDDPESIPIPRTAYTDPLDEIGISYEVWDANTLGSPQLVDLRPFQIVMWRINDSFYVSDSTLTSQDQGTIQQYLNSGGAFFMSSMEILSRLGDVPFRRNVLRVQQFIVNPDPFSECPTCDEDVGVPVIHGPPTEPVTHGVLTDLDYSLYPFFDFGIFQIGPDLGDTFTVSTNAAAIFLENFSGKPCGMKYPRIGQESTGRVVFLSFPIDTIPETGPAPNNRAAVLRNILQFLAPGYGGFGTIVMDRSEYTLPDVITIEMGDSDLAGAGQAIVHVFSQSFPSRVPVVLIETGEPGLFRGAITLVSGSEPDGPGLVRANTGDALVAEYLDAGTPVQASARVDTTPPFIFNLDVEEEFEAATVSWDTSEHGDALVQYGESLLFGRAEYVAQLTDFHEVRLSGLVPDRLYYYKVTSRDLAGNVVESVTNTFHTLAPVIPPWYDDLETGATNWTTLSAEDSQSIWQLGVPRDPWDGNAWASNLGEGPLDYTETFLVSPALDLTGASDATLQFAHRYDFTPRSEFDLVEGGQLLIITNPVTAPVLIAEYIDLMDWDVETVDLRPYVGHVVFIVWYYALLSFDLVERPGWVVDDVSVTINDTVRVARPTVLPGNMVRVEWNSSRGTLYRLEGSTDARNWAPVTDWIEATSTSTSVTLPMSTALLLRVAAQP